jgi:hypothetical protein
MAKTTVAIHPPPTGVWPHGEPQSVRDCAPEPMAAARSLPCPQCHAAAGAPCRRTPEADHLARYTNAYADGRISREHVAAVFAECKVITRYVYVDAAVAS